MAREHHPEIGDRLRRIRSALGYSGNRQAKAFADKYGFPYGAWWHWERGLGLPWPQAVKITKLMKGLTLDYIYLGETRTLSVEVESLLERDGD